MEKVSLPYNGKYFRAKTKKFNETILFVPFFEASQRKLLRHVKFVTDLGYDAVLFDLAEPPALLNFTQGLTAPLKNWRDFTRTWSPPINSRGKFGLKAVYADQIENLLNLIPGRKILFSFSNPTGAAIEALAHRYCYDVTGLICDSGPSGKFIESVMNLYRSEWTLDLWVLRAALAPTLGLIWSPQLHKDIPGDLAKFPKGFKILSIRGWKDKIIPPDHIDAVFAQAQDLDWRKLNLPEAEHVKGLRDCGPEYKPAVQKFLKEISSPLITVEDRGRRRPARSL